MLDGWLDGYPSTVVSTRAPAVLKTQNREKRRSWKNDIGVYGQSLLSRHTPQYQRSTILVTQDFDIQLVQHCHALFYRGDIMRAVATNWFGKNLATRREGKGQSWDWVLWITLIRKDFKRFWRKKQTKIHQPHLTRKNIAESTKGTGVGFFSQINILCD